MTTRRSWLALPAVFATACTQAPKEVKKKEPEKPPEPVTGRTAFHTMFASARAWAQDAQVVQVQSMHLPEIKAENGKYPAWQAMLASPSKARLKTYTYSVIEAGGNLHKGIFALSVEAFSGSRGQAKPFLVQAIKVDTDAVWETAAKKSVEYMKKYPDMPVTFLLEQTPRFPNAAWRVIWGESVNTSNYSIFVDASTGEYLATGR